MSSNQTTNYQLHSWEPGDDFLRSEFNENFAAIDLAVAGKATVITGSYTGNGNSSRTISLGFQPKAVIVKRAGDYEADLNTSQVGYVPTMAITGKGGDTLTVTADGFRVNGQMLVNRSGYSYIYLALR